MSRTIRSTTTALGAGALLLTSAAAAFAGGIVVTVTGEGKAVNASSAYDHTVHATCTAAASNTKYAGYFVGEEYRALYAVSQTGYYDAYFPGIGGIYVAGGVWDRAASRTLVVNGGDESLEAGDIVAVAGVVANSLDQQPMLAVTKASATAHPAIVGVAVQAIRVEARSEEGRETIDVQPVDGPAPPGGTLAIVSSGLVARVKVGASLESLRPGDWITASPVPGIGRRIERRKVSAKTPDSASVEAIETHSATVPGPATPLKPINLASPGEAWPAFPADSGGSTAIPDDAEVDDAIRQDFADDWNTPRLGIAAAPVDIATGTVPVFVILR